MIWAGYMWDLLVIWPAETWKSIVQVKLVHRKIQRPRSIHTAFALEEGLLSSQDAALLWPSHPLWHHPERIWAITSLRSNPLLFWISESCFLPPRLVEASIVMAIEFAGWNIGSCCQGSRHWISISTIQHHHLHGGKCFSMMLII
jgi:hypothetical protein